MADAAPVNMLLLCRDAEMARSVAAQAAELGPLATTSSPEAAMVRLSSGYPPVSHLLLQPEAAGRLRPDLDFMTRRDCDAGADMVVLGREPPSPGWLRHALSVPKPPCAPVPATADLGRAIAEGRLMVRYQPVVRLADMRPIGVEALARIELESGAILPPRLFLPQIEAAGLARSLCEAIVRRTFADWAGGSLAARGLLLGINLPLEVMVQPDLLAFLESARGAFGIPPHSLVLELTETQELDSIYDRPALVASMGALRAGGYRLAIDDVGPGLRDAKTLAGMPFHSLKLDKYLVRQAAESPKALAEIAVLVARANREGLLVVAEGIEDPATRDCMAGIGIEMGQGFLFGRPLPATALPLWYRDWMAKLSSPAGSPVPGG